MDLEEPHAVDGAAEHLLEVETPERVNALLREFLSQARWTTPLR
ncbi:MAG: hypothetical protein ACT4P4_14870 [Betaproteobacteria bacterium]